jgi:Putative ATPase subunit of terminase (gpP-like)
MSDNDTALVPVPVKRSAGRPKGATDKKTRYSPKKKAEAKALYLAGNLPEEIVTMCKVKDAKIIEKWAKEENWDADRIKVMEISSSNILDNILRTQLETFNGLQIIKDKSLNRIKAIDGKNPLPVKYSEAVNAYIGSVDLEYKMKTDTLHARFLVAVAEVLKDKIQDKDLLRDIIEELGKVYTNYTNKNIPPARAEVPVDGS